MNSFSKIFLIAGLLASACALEAMERPVEKPQTQELITQLLREVHAGDFDRYFALLDAQPTDQQRALCNVQLELKTKKTAVHFAAEQGNTAALTKLLQRGASIKECDTYERTPFFYAAGSGSISSLSLLLAQGASVANIDCVGWSALHCAAAHGKVDAINMLIKQCKLDVNYAAPFSNWDSIKGNSPLHLAAVNGHVPAIKALIDNGAHKGALNRHGDTALHLAAEGGKIAAITSLIEDHGFDPNLVNKCGQTPLYSAAAEGSGEAINRLVRLGARTDVFDKYGKTPLHRAARNNKGSNIAILISDHKFDPEIFIGSESSLLTAIANHCCFSEFALRCAGARLSNQEKKCNYTTSCLGPWKTDSDKQTQLAALSRESLAPWDLNSVDPTDNATALMRAVKRNCISCVKLLLKDKRTDPNIIAGGSTALHHAVRRFNRPEICGYLLNLPRIDVTLRDVRNLTAKESAYSHNEELLPLFELRTMRFKLYLSLKNARCSEECTEERCSHAIHFPVEICKKIAGMLTVDSLPKTSS